MPLTVQTATKRPDNLLILGTTKSGKTTLAAQEIAKIGEKPLLITFGAPASVEIPYVMVGTREDLKELSGFIAKEAAKDHDSLILDNLEGLRDIIVDPLIASGGLKDNRQAYNIAAMEMIGYVRSATSAFGGRVIATAQLVMRGTPPALTSKLNTEAADRIYPMFNRIWYTYVRLGKFETQTNTQLALKYQPLPLPDQKK